MYPCRRIEIKSIYLLIFEQEINVSLLGPYLQTTNSTKIGSQFGWIFTSRTNASEILGTQQVFLPHMSAPQHISIHGSQIFIPKT